MGSFLFVEFFSVATGSSVGYGSPDLLTQRRSTATRIRIGKRKNEMVFIERLNANGLESDFMLFLKIILQSVSTLRQEPPSVLPSLPPTCSTAGGNYRRRVLHGTSPMYLPFKVMFGDVGPEVAHLTAYVSEGIPSISPRC
jgi:hypothetical protein